MNKMRIIFCLLIAVPLALLTILCVQASYDFETNEGKETVASPLFVSSVDRFIQSGVQKIQTNYIGGSGDSSGLSFRNEVRVRDGEAVIAFHNGNIVEGFGPSFLRLDWEAAIRITPQELEPYWGWEIIAGRFYHWENHTNEGILKIYDDGTETTPGELLGSESYNVSGTGWKRINLTTPVPLDAARDIWTSFFIVKHGGVDFPMGIDNGPAVPGKGDWVKTGENWMELMWYGFDFNFGIETILRESPMLKAWAYGPYGGLPGEEIHFRGGASGGIPPYSWHWDFGDNTTSTDQYPSHAYQSIGNYTVALTVNDSNASAANTSTWALIAHVPPTNPTITGPHYGRPGIVYTFCIEGVTDPEGDAIYCTWNWGDGNSSGWLGPFNSGEPFCASHVWSQEGTFLIQVKCKDSYGTESAWSDPFTIVIEAGEPVVKITKPQRAIYIHNKSIFPRLFGMCLIIGDIDIIVNASDNVSGIGRVELFIDEELTANFTAPPFSFLWTNDNGSHLFHIHIIKAVVYDNAGNSADSKIFVRRFF